MQSDKYDGNHQGGNNQNKQPVCYRLCAHGALKK